MTSRLALLIGSIMSCLVVYPATSQIIADQTAKTLVVDNCANICQISGGNLSGSNLFHSFQDFNIRSGESVYFADPGVQNILTRVTGSNPSEIFGTLGVSGPANLFLLNPQGIIFGIGSNLDLNGSFVATTADTIEFGDLGSFSAIPHHQENLALLTIHPEALFFNQETPNHSIKSHTGSFLTVPQQQSITLVGAQTSENAPGISIEGSVLRAPQGNISIAAIADSGSVGLDPKFQPNISDNQQKGNLHITQNSMLDTSGTGGGSIVLEGNRIDLSQQATIASSTLGNVDGGKILILAQDLIIRDGSRIFSTTQDKGSSPQIEIIGQESISLVGSQNGALGRMLQSSQSSSIETGLNDTSINSIATGNGRLGKITISSNNLVIQNGAWILATTTDHGAIDNITIDVRKNTILDQGALISGSAHGSKGRAGDINLRSKNLFMQKGSVISASTLGEGTGGDINLEIADNIHLHKSPIQTFIPTGIFTNTVFGNGTAGNIQISAQEIFIQDGAEISSGSGSITQAGINFSGGHGGNIIIDSTNSIIIKGISPDHRFPSGISTRTFSQQPAGDIEIKTNHLELLQEAIISASSFGEGDSGDLTIDADESIVLNGTSFSDLQNLFLEGLSGEIEFDNITGGLLANTQNGQAGEIKITTPDLILDRGALISTSTFGAVNGGNIKIIADNIDVKSSIISSSATSNGDAGNIDINTNNLVTSDSALIATSTIGAGNGGNLKVNASESVSLLDSSPSGIVPGGFSATSLGFSYPGNIEINTPYLEIRGGATVDASNGETIEILQGELGQIPIETQLDLNSPREIIINADSLAISGASINSFTSGIHSTTNSAFPASNVTINTSKLSITNQGEIEVNSLGAGQAGNLAIVADRINLVNGGNLNATTSSGQGGNIQISATDLVTLNQNATIQTDAMGAGNGGNIELDSTFAIIWDESLISAQAQLGQGGNINILVKDLFITPESFISASSKLGIDGEVNIQTFTTNNRDSFTKLPESTINEDETVIAGCGTNYNNQSVFSYVGKGGLAASPFTEFHLSNQDFLPDFTLVNITPEPNHDLKPLSKTKTSEKIMVEASSWVLNAQGRVELLAQVSKPNLLPTRCPFSEISNSSTSRID